jgi:hypothetical protein
MGKISHGGVSDVNIPQGEVGAAVQDDADVQPLPTPEEQQAEQEEKAAAEEQEREELETGGMGERAFRRGPDSAPKLGDSPGDPAYLRQAAAEKDREQAEKRETQEQPAPAETQEKPEGVPSSGGNSSATSHSSTQSTPKQNAPKRR